MDSYELVCRECCAVAPHGTFRCPRCSAELTTRYRGYPCADPEQRGMWRWAAVLPVDPSGPIITLGEGGTPLVRLGDDRGAASVSIKCEHLNPTGSFKDRVLAVAATRVVQQGLRGFVGTSSGNGGAAAAAYARRGGFPAVLFTLSDVAEQKLLQIRALGAHAFTLRGIGHDAATTAAAADQIADAAADARFSPVLTGGRYAPEAMDGATTIAYEIFEQNPETTVVYVPVGGGGLLSAIGRGFSRLAAAGVTVPRVVAVQPSGCPTLREAADGDFTGLSDETATQISGLQVATLFDGPGAWEAIRGTGGHLVEVDDDAVLRAQAELVERDGVLVEPAGATAFAGFLADAAAGNVSAEDRVVVIGTGAGYKDQRALEAMAEGSEPVRSIALAQLASALEALVSPAPKPDTA